MDDLGKSMLRKTWRMRGFFNDVIIVPRIDLREDDEPLHNTPGLSILVNRWLDDPISLRAVLEMWEFVNGQTGFQGRPWTQPELRSFVRFQLEEAFRQGRLVILPGPRAPAFGVEREEEPEPA